MSTLKGTTMHPRCRHIGACWDLLECWFKLFSTSQNTSQIQFWTQKENKSKFNFKFKKKKIGFPWCSTHEDLSIDVSITNVGLILTKPRWFLLDSHSFGILTWKHVGTQKISTQSSKLVVSRRSLYASPEDGDAQLTPPCMIHTWVLLVTQQS